MNYTVVWTPAAENDLAAIWMAAVDRDAITSASYTIDKMLAQNPAVVGAVSFDTVRTLWIAPLGVDYEVIEADRIVYVLSAWTRSIESNGASA